MTTFGQPSSGVGWLWPLPTFCGREAGISSQYGPRGGRMHLGNDIMYRRLPGETDHRPQGSKHWYMPLWIPVIAAAPGRIVYAVDTTKGATVVIDHGWRAEPTWRLGGTFNRWFPTGVRWWTYYTHMRCGSLFVQPRPPGPRGHRYELHDDNEAVAAGQPLGWVRGNPEDGRGAIWHLHFEMWSNPATHTTVDPATWMARWGRRTFNVNFGVVPPQRCAPETDDEIAVPAPSYTTPAACPRRRAAPAAAAAPAQLGAVTAADVELGAPWPYPTPQAPALLDELRMWQAAVARHDSILRGVMRAVGCFVNRTDADACEDLSKVWASWAPVKAQWDAFYRRWAVGPSVLAIALDSPLNRSTREALQAQAAQLRPLFHTIELWQMYAGPEVL